MKHREDTKEKEIAIAQLSFAGCFETITKIFTHLFHFTTIVITFGAGLLLPSISLCSISIHGDIVEAEPIIGGLC